MLALLHPVAQISLSRFSVHPSTVIGIVIVGAIYLWRAHRGPSEADRYPVNVSPHTATEEQRLKAAEEPGPTPLMKVSFFTSLALLFLSLNGPLHDLSDYFLFSAHMLQHLLLTLVVPPLMIYGVADWMLRPLIRNRIVYRIAQANTSTVACFVWFNVVLAFWHLPIMYNAALAHHSLHIVQHLMFISASVLMWWPLLSPMSELPRASYPVQILYLFLLVIPMSVISIYITMSDSLLYPAYAAAPRILRIAPMEDQQYGGLIMWIPGGIFFYLIMTVVFFRWQARGGDDTASAQVDWVSRPRQG